MSSTAQTSPLFTIGLIGTGRIYSQLAGLLINPEFVERFPWVRLMGAARYSGQENDDSELEVIGEFPLYNDYSEMLEKCPNLNLVIDLTGDADLFPRLKSELPSTTSLINQISARFLWEVITSELLCVSCAGDLHYHKSLLATLFEEVEEDILLLDLEGNIMDMNRTAYQRKGKTKEELLGLPCWGLEGKDFCCEVKSGKCPYKETLKSGKKSESLHTFVDEDGRMRYFRVYTYPIFGAGDRLANVLEIRRDITHRTQMEVRLQQSEKMAAIGELATYIAHEIRNPLFAIGGFANSLLRSSAINESDREKVRIILEESKRLDGILRSTLNFARPTEAKEGRVDVNKVAKDCMDLLGIGLSQKIIQLNLELNPDIAAASGDPDLIKQCLINLVKNSSEAMPDGGGIISVRTGMNQSFVYLQVEDTGLGIPEEIRGKVFNPFYSTKGQGAGLGLAMTKKIIEDMGGEVELTSQENVGTRITLYLPPVLAVDEKEE